MINFIKEFCQEKGFDNNTYHQILIWLFGKFVSSFDEMTNLKKSVREQLKELDLNPLKVVIHHKGEHSEKFAFRTKDGNIIESVLMKHDKGRRTVCVSSQINCAMGCKFCATGAQKFKRNLSVRNISAIF